ncbi:MAG: potassium transporter TrkA, partial [Acidobacteria bacterium]|nr:potassium transporter TrkA [Acidobacteriota bacterium]
MIVGVISMVLVQLLTGALIATGLPPDIAGFQARSAFSGAGFTTTESENVVNHGARRKIISVAMLVGSLGTPTLVVTVVVGLIAPGPGSTTERTLVAISGIMLIFLVLGARPMKNLMLRVGN